MGWKSPLNALPFWENMCLLFRMQIRVSMVFVALLGTKIYPLPRHKLDDDVPFLQIWSVSSSWREVSLHSPEQPATLAGGDGTCSLEMELAALKCVASAAFWGIGIAWHSYFGGLGDCQRFGKRVKSARIEQCIQCRWWTTSAKCQVDVILGLLGRQALQLELQQRPKPTNSTSIPTRPNRRFFTLADSERWGWIYHWTVMDPNSEGGGQFRYTGCEVSLIDQIYRVPLPETNSSHLKISHPKRKGSSSNYQFSGASC